MNLPLISHPTRNEAVRTYDEGSLTDRGDLRLTAHNRVVSDRALRLYGDCDETTEYLQAAAALHDFGKATPQFQAYIRPDETASCPDEETTHARLGALATWYVLGQLGAPHAIGSLERSLSPDTTKHSPTLPSIPRKRWLVLSKTVTA